MQKRAIWLDMKHYIATAVVIAVVVFGFFLLAPRHIAEEADMPPERLTPTEETASLNLFENDVDVVEAVKRCEAQALLLTDCVAQLRQNNFEVTGLVPDEIGADGFQGLMVFPLQGGNTVIMDYNTQDLKRQFLYFGTYESLKDAVDQGALDHTSQENFNSLRQAIND